MNKQRLREAISVAARTHPAYRRFQNGKLANKIVDLLTPEYVEDPPLPMAQELIDVVNETLDLLPPSGEIPPLSDKGMQSWFETERKLLELVEHMRRSYDNPLGKMYIALNVQVYLKMVTEKVRLNGLNEQWLDLYYARVMSLCTTLTYLAKSDSYQARSTK